MRAFVLLLLFCASAAPATKWSRAGEFSQVSIGENGKIALDVRADSLAGAVSNEFAVSGNVLLVHADVSNAPARGVTIAVQSGESGESIGYWQNVLPVKGASPVNAAISLSNQPRSARLFVGSDRVSSKAVIENISWKISTRCAAAHGSAYGSLVDSQHVAAQSFTASKSHLDAVIIRMRQLNDAGGPSLRARLFHFDKRDKVLAETVVSRDRIPSPKQHDEIELCIPLASQLTLGQRYFLEFSAADECSKDQAYLLYAGDDSYPNGARFENGSDASNWDLYFETFESD